MDLRNILESMGKRRREPTRSYASRLQPSWSWPIWKMQMSSKGQSTSQTFNQSIYSLPAVPLYHERAKRAEIIWETDVFLPVLSGNPTYTPGCHVIFRGLHRHGLGKRLGLSWDSVKALNIPAMYPLRSTKVSPRCHRTIGCRVLAYNTVASASQTHCPL
jgi:hypothetical protein